MWNDKYLLVYKLCNFNKKRFHHSYKIHNVSIINGIQIYNTNKTMVAWQYYLLGQDFEYVSINY